MSFGKEDLIAVLGVLITVVGILWKMHSDSSKREQERLAKCEIMHAESQKQVVSLTGEYRELKGRMDGVEKLSASVLSELRKQE